MFKPQSLKTLGALLLAKFTFLMALKQIAIRGTLILRMLCVKQKKNSKAPSSNYAEFVCSGRKLA